MSEVTAEDQAGSRTAGPVTTRAGGTASRTATQHRNSHRRPDRGRRPVPAAAKSGLLSRRLARPRAVRPRGAVHRGLVGRRSPQEQLATAVHCADCGVGLDRRLCVPRCPQKPTQVSSPERLIRSTAPAGGSPDRRGGQVAVIDRTSACPEAAHHQSAPL